ncbi:MAG: EF-P lysine aminoacylase EpmA [Desulfobulbaceae bacterium]|nr:EF-P lysine aminoacylase EpmA [Desulfobulbaceae bacterium]
MPSARVLWQRATLIQTIRAFFVDRGYLEVDTPVRIPAPAPELHIEAEPAGEWFLQTSPELCMKRLLAAGLPRIFQICKCFRRHERGSRHLPEFTMLEWYRSDSDYHDLMVECEELFRFLADGLGLGGKITVAGQEVALAGPWERLTVAEAFRRHGSMSAAQALAGGCFDEVLVGEIEPRLGLVTPTFLFDYPAELGALARLKPGDATVAERFEIYVAGLELANGFSELTDPVEQRRRFEYDRARMAQLGRNPGPMPEPFLDALAHLGPAAGIALGVDRLVMVMAGADAMDQVVPFTPETL